MTAVAPATIDPRIGWIGWIGFLGMILLALLGARTVLAEPSEPVEVAMVFVSAPLPAAIAFSADVDAETIHSHSTDGLVHATDAPLVVEIADDPEPVRSPENEAARVVPIELLFMNGLGGSSWSPLTADESLAVAVAHGSSRDLKPRNPFRKRSRDLFKTEFREVTILRAEMKMRLRLRAKTRNAISLEVRF